MHVSLKLRAIYKKLYFSYLKYHNVDILPIELGYYLHDPLYTGLFEVNKMVDFHLSHTQRNGDGFCSLRKIILNVAMFYPMKIKLQVTCLLPDVFCRCSEAAMVF